MKKVLPIIFLMMIGSFVLFAQQGEESGSKKTEKNDSEESADFGKNELKLNVFNAILSAVDVNYERIFKNNTAAGLSAAYCFYADDFQGGSPGFLWSFIPHYRIYFGKKQSAGLFLEANGQVAQTRRVTGYGHSDSFGNWEHHTVYRDHMGYGVGFAVGAKFLTAKGLVGEVFGGAGRYFNKAEYMSELYPRAGVLIGKRF